MIKRFASWRRISRSAKRNTTGNPFSIRNALIYLIHLRSPERRTLTTMRRAAKGRETKTQGSYRVSSDDKCDFETQLDFAQKP